MQQVSELLPKERNPVVPITEACENFQVHHYGTARNCHFHRGLVNDAQSPSEYHLNKNAQHFAETVVFATRFTKLFVVYATFL